MKKIIIIMAILLTYYVNCSTTIVKSIIILNGNSISPYENIWKAICIVESNNNIKAFNPKENATGIVQIRPIRLKDYNQRTNSHYKLVDCYKIEVSKKIFMYYALQYKHNESNKIATDWNKCKGDGYWNKVKRSI